MRKSFRESWPVWALFSVFVLWLGFLCGFAYEDGMNLADFMRRFSQVLERPFSARWTSHTPVFLAGALAGYVCAIGYFYATRQNRRPGEEHGSAKWGNVKQLDRKYREKDPEQNVILSQNLRMGLDGRKHRRNLLQIVVGGSGSGKTRFLVKPNIFLANTSYICTDPKGEILRAVGPLLLQKGYTLRVFDLIDPILCFSHIPGKSRKWPLTSRTPVPYYRSEVRIFVRVFFWGVISWPAGSRSLFASTKNHIMRPWSALTVA